MGKLKDDAMLVQRTHGDELYM